MKSEKMCTVWMSHDMPRFVARSGKLVVVVETRLEDKTIEISVVEQWHPIAVGLCLAHLPIELLVHCPLVVFTTWAGAELLFMQNIE